METKQNADPVERKENPVSRSASTQRPACHITRRMSSAAAGKLVDESAVKRKFSHEATEGEEEEEGAARVGKGGGLRVGKRVRQRDGGNYGRGQRDRRHGGRRRGRGQVRERVRLEGVVGGRRRGGGGGGGCERGAGLEGEGTAHEERTRHGAERAGHIGFGAGHGGEGEGHGGVGAVHIGYGAVLGGGHGGDGVGRAAAESGGRPSRPGFIWQLGSRLEAKDFMNIWYSAKIINIDDRDKTVLIHFDGWNQRYDEWVKMDSSRLRPLTRHSDRRKKSEKRSPKSKPMYKVGENVYARWSDCRMYPAKVVVVNADGSYEVMFEDGVKKTVQCINVDMKPPLSSIGSGVRPAESTGKRTRYASADGASIESSPTDEKTKTIRKVRGCCVRVKRCLSATMDEEHDDVACKQETVSVAGEEPCVADEVKMEDEDVKDEIAGIELQLQQQLSSEDVTSDSSPVKRRLIHVKTIHGKLKRTLPSSSALPADCKAEAEVGTKLKCPHSDCNKEFRNSTLVQYHLKYYHPEDRIDHPLSQLPDKRRSASSFSESPASVHEFPCKKAKRSKTVDCHGNYPDEAAVGLADQSMSSSSPSSLLHTHSSPSPQVFIVIPKESFVGRSKASSRRIRHARRKHRNITKIRDRTIAKKVINCLCEVDRETSQLIQCSVCLCWQHLQCLEEEETNLTRRYICRMCTHPPGLRESAKYSFDQDWLVDGRLADYDASLGGTAMVEPAYGLAGKAKIMKITHQLVADLHGVKQVIDSVDRCIFVAREKVEPEFSHWMITNKDDETVRAAAERAGDAHLASQHPSVVDSKGDEQLTNNVANGCGHNGKLSQSSTEEESVQTKDKRMQQQHHQQQQQSGERSNGKSITAVVKQEKDADFDEAVDTSRGFPAAADTPGKDAVVGLNPTEVPYDSLPGSRLLTNSVKSISEKEGMTGRGRELLDEEDLKCDAINGAKCNLQVKVNDDLLDNAGERETEDEKIDDLSGSATSSADEGEEDEEEEDSEVDGCQNHLLNYISQLQDGIEDSIAIIEEQVTALESAEGNGNSTEDVLRDLPRVKKTLNQLLTDVGKVQQISFCQ